MCPSPASNDLFPSAWSPSPSGQHPSLSAELGFAVLRLFWSNPSLKAACATAEVRTVWRADDLEHPATNHAKSLTGLLGPNFENPISDISKTLMGMDSFAVLFDSIDLKVLQVKHKIMKFAG